MNFNIYIRNGILVQPRKGTKIFYIIIWNSLTKEEIFVDFLVLLGKIKEIWVYI